MDQYHRGEGYGQLNIDRKYYNRLDIEGFSQMMKDPSYCYKFYWLEAIVQLISYGAEETTFDELIDEMIANAWYSVREYHIHLSGLSADGEVRDGLERAVNCLADYSRLRADASKTEIKNAIRDHNKQLKPYKEQLTNMVPYRALAGFFDHTKERAEWKSIRRMTAYIRRINDSVLSLPYTIGDTPKLGREVYFSRDWVSMIRDHTVNILGWIRYEKVRWLQNYNPEVPGLIYKLAPMDEKARHLSHVRSLWEGILDIHPVRDVFTGEEIRKQQYDVDHFIPWSFVMNDELWNLMPMDSSLNSSKSNRLPDWDPFFGIFADNQYIMYGLIYDRPELYKRFKSCWRDNLHSIWAGQELYRSGNTKDEFVRILEKNMRPVYDSARRQGYELWHNERYL